MSATTATLSFKAAASGPDLCFKVTLDDQIIFDTSLSAEPVLVNHDFDDSEESDHLLVFELSGKLPEHTEVNDAGEIVLDRCVIIEDIEFDKISLGHMVTEIAQYHHDTNGSTGPLIDQFFGIMGCNGRVEIRFSTPIYLWLLENM